MRQNIPIDFEKLKSNYPHRTSKEGQFGGKLAHKDLREFMSHTPGTPCCVQVSHSFNMAGHYIPQTYEGGRRFNSPIKINGRVHYYILAVDEMEKYLTQQYGPGELVSHDESNKRRNYLQVQSYLKGRTGLLVMRDSTPGVHTEFWDGSSFLQKDMAVKHLLELPRVLFWDCTLAPPQWLEDFMGPQQ